MKVQEWQGPSAVRHLLAAHLGDLVDYWLSFCTWRELPDRALVVASDTAFRKLKEWSADLRAIGWALVLEKGRAA